MNRTYLVILIIVGLAVGFVAGWFTSPGKTDEKLITRVEKLEEQVSGLASKGEVENLSAEVNELAQRVGKAAGPAGLKMGYVNAEKAFKEFKGTEEVIKKYREEGAKIQREYQELQPKVEKGEITREEAEEKANQLRAKLSQIDQLLTQAEAAQIAKIVDEIADKENYDVVTREKNVLLYLKATLALEKIEGAEEFVEISEEELDQEAVSLLKDVLKKLGESEKDQVTSVTTSKHVDALLILINQKSLEKYDNLQGWNNVIKYGDNFYKITVGSPIDMLTYKVIDRMNEKSQEIVDQVIELLNQYLEKAG